MGVFEAITHSEEIEELISSAKSMYDSASERLEEHRKTTSKSLEYLGRLKLEAWSGDMNTFLGRFGVFAHVQMKCIDDPKIDFIERSLTPNQVMVNMRTATLNAREVLKIGALSVGTGALVGIASYGGAMMFAKASTGTAIAALSGVAKTNATLAWFGGGSLKAGGMGMLGGKVVLSGISLAPILITAGVIAATKGKERLDEARKIHAEAENAVAQMETIITGLTGIERISEGYIELLGGLSKRFRPFLDEMESIAKDYTPGPDGKIDFDQLSEMEQKTLHLSWLMAQLYYHALSKPILTDDGKVDVKASKMLTYYRNEYIQLKANVTNLEAEKGKIKGALTAAEKTFSDAVSALDTQRKSFKKYYENQGRKSIQQWASVINPFAETISKFENIDVANIFASPRFNQEIGDAFESIFAITNSTRNILNSGIKNVDEASLADIAIGGVGPLTIETESEDTVQALSETRKSGMAAWLQNGFDVSPMTVVADSLPLSKVEDVKILIDDITGKENLEEAESISKRAAYLAKTIETAVGKMKKSRDVIKKQVSCLKRIGRLISLYKNEVERIYNSHKTADSDATVDFELLPEEERKVLQIACNLAKLYYCVANAKIFGVSENDQSSVLAENAVKEAKKELKSFRSVTFKMTGTELRAANVMWSAEAHNMFALNCVFVALFAILTVVQTINGFYYGLIGIAGIVIAFPWFFVFKNLRESQLWAWRLARLIIACTVVMAVEIIGMVV